MSAQEGVGLSSQPHSAILLPNDNPLASEWKKLFHQIEKQEIFDAEQASCKADPEAAKELLSFTDKQDQTCVQHAAAAGFEALAARMTQWLQESPRQATAAETQAETELQKPGEALEVKLDEAPQPDNAQGMAATLDVQGETQTEAERAQGSHAPRDRDQNADAAQDAADDEKSKERFVRRQGEQGKVVHAQRDHALAQKPEVPNEIGDAPADAASAVHAEDAPRPNTRLGVIEPELRQKQESHVLAAGQTSGAPAKGEDDADGLEARTRPTLGGSMPPYGSRRESPASSVNSSAREEEDEGTSALLSELQQLRHRAGEIEQEFEAMEHALKEAEEANAKVVSRVASLLGDQSRYDVRRLHAQHRMSTHQEDLDEQPLVTIEGYERALLQTAQLDAQVTAVKQQLQQLLESQTPQQNHRGAKVLECREAFANFVIQVAKNSFMQHGGRPVSEQQVKKLLQLGEEKQQSINSLRRELMLFHYQQELQQAQSFHKAQWEEEQYTPLEAMDLEQLKMENQTLNERLVERQEEARKLQAITRNSVQLLTHWREKLAFQEKRNVEAAAQLAALDAELAQQREVAAHLKRQRAECRQQNERIKCQTDLLDSELLAANWEATQEKLRETEAQRDRKTTRLTSEASKLLMRHLKTLPTHNEGLSANERSVDESSASCVDSDKTHALLSASVSIA